MQAAWLIIVEQITKLGSYRMIQTQTRMFTEAALLNLTQDIATFLQHKWTCANITPASLA